tara:strand:+ start:1854 stop:2450 length:597 start_codon:yes stop_codon:yes gene_type:complete
MKRNTFEYNYFENIKSVADKIDLKSIQKTVKTLINVKKSGGRVFFIGVGGSAANCSHAVNDFRKILDIESYTPTDNVSELTARINDESWDMCFNNYLKTSKINKNDCVFVMSVGGGNIEKKISMNIYFAIKYAKKKGCKILGIVGRDGGQTIKYSDSCILIPVVDEKLVTPLTEAYQAVVWHLIVSHPLFINKNKTKW